MREITAIEVCKRGITLMISIFLLIVAQRKKRPDITVAMIMGIEVARKASTCRIGALPVVFGQ